MTAMNDRELLEAAARAAGIELGVWTAYGHYVGGLEGCIWNPLADDGDALRLAVKLRIAVEFTYGGIEVRASWRVNKVFAGNVVEEIGSLRNGDEPSAAVRRAIVRAAAALTPKDPE